MEKINFEVNFIICGAMKAGTTTLRNILNSCEQVFIPDHEIYFFDMDDALQHPDFLINNKGLTTHNIYDNLDLYYNWYKSFYDNLPDSTLKGEDSTTYLASNKVPPRIKNIFPDVKLIFMLRDPVERTISHYWHLVKTGRTTMKLEKMLKYKQETLLQRSYYKDQILRYKSIFDDDQLKFIVFEEFIENMQGKIDEICNYLNIEEKINIDTINTHFHKTKYPIFHRLRLFINHFFKDINRYNYLPSENYGASRESRNEFVNSLKLPLLPATKKLIDLKSTKPKISISTRNFLENHFVYENRGISKLIDQDVTKWWPYFK